MISSIACEQVQYLATSSRQIPHKHMACMQTLNTLEAVLRIDEAVALLLLAVLDHDGDTEKENHIDGQCGCQFENQKQVTDTRSRTDNAEISSEDDVEERVSERSERSSAASQLSGDKRRSAHAVLNERWRGAVGITAAVELYQMSAKLRRMQAYFKQQAAVTYFLLQQTLRLCSLLAPKSIQVCSSLECLKPQIQAENHGEDGTKPDKVTVALEPKSVSGQHDSQQRHHESDEDEDRIDDGTC